MSVLPHTEPGCSEVRNPTIELVIEARARELGDGFTVRRLLPSTSRQMVGPFIFFDHMGPVGLDPGHGLDVRPHPHINLATVTYLFEGEILHRDSLGSEQLIQPGAVNWMTAGRGIVHSERSPTSARKTGPRVHGLQLWVALPTACEETAPTFHHYPAGDIPALDLPGARVRVIAGSAFGATSPVKVWSELFCAEAELDSLAEVALPEEHLGRAAYVVEGSIACDGQSFSPGTMLVLHRGGTPRITALDHARVVLLGGAPLDGERHIWWNFVSSSPERIDRARSDWRERRFGVVPGDEQEFIPLPD
jgi:redox-sensitive bicupin YhaK (pirin superfamily)